MKWAELLVPFFNVVYVIIAIVMIGLILMQKGAGAQAGSSFGAGASGTVFGARGSANFLSRSTSVCAAIFFIISIGMGIYVAHGGRVKPNAPGLMSEYAQPAKPPVSELPGGAAVLPAAIPASAIPLPTSGSDVPGSNAVPVNAPSAPSAVTPPAEAPVPVNATPAGTTPEK